MKIKQILALAPAIAALSMHAHASANLSGVVGTTVTSASSPVSAQPMSLLPCAPSPENATALLVLFGAAGLFAGYQLRRLKQDRSTAVASL